MKKAIALASLALAIATGCNDDLQVQNHVVPTKCEGEFKAEGNFDLTKSFSANGVFYLPAQSITLTNVANTQCQFKVAFKDSFIQWTQGDTDALLKGKATIETNYP